jgi:hypothetical protein
MRFWLMRAGAIAIPVVVGAAIGAGVTNPVHAASDSLTPEAILTANHVAVGKLPSTGGAEIDYATSG